MDGSVEIGFRDWWIGKGDIPRRDKFGLDVLAGAEDSSRRACRRRRPVREELVQCSWMDGV